MSAHPSPFPTKPLPHEQTELLQASLQNIVQLLGVDSAACFLDESQELRLVAQHGLGHLTADQFTILLDCNKLLASLAQPSARPMYVVCSGANPTCPNCNCALMGYQTVLFTPITHPAEAHAWVMGSIVLYSKHNRQFTPTEEQIVVMMSQQLALTLERGRLLAAERIARAQAEVLREVGNVLNSNLEFPTLVQALLEQMGRVIPFDSANLAMLSHGRAIVVASRGYENFGHDVNGLELRIDHFPNLQALLTRETPLYIEDTATNAYWQNDLADATHVRAWIGAPIRVDGQVVAILSADKIDPHFYQPIHVEMIAALANQAALALHNAQLFAESQRQTEQMHVLHQFSRRLTGLMTVQEVCTAACQHACEELGYNAAAVYTAIAPKGVLVRQAAEATSAWAAELFPPDENLFLRRAFSEGQPIWQVLPTEQSPLGELAMPLVVGHEVLGVFHVSKVWIDGIAPSEMDLLHIIAGQLAIALEKTRFFEETTRQAQELRTLFDLSAALRTAPSVNDILNIIVLESMGAMKCAGSSVMLVGTDGRDLFLRACYPENPIALGTRYTFGHGIVGHVAQTQRPYTAPDIFRDPLTHIPEQDRVRINAARSSLSVPIQTQDQLVGVLNVWFTEIHQFTHENEALLVAMAEIAGSAIQRATVLATLEKRVEERTRELEQANTQLQRLDALKTRFVSEVSHELRTPIANLMLYIDLFKRSQGKPDRQQRYVDVLEKQAARLGALVDNVLYLSRLDLGREKVVLTAVDLNEVVEEVLQAQFVRAEALGLELTYEAKSHALASNPWQEGKRPFQVLGERNQLAQMITHLVTNALSYTLQGYVHITLFIDSPKFLCLEIADSGVGIPIGEWDDLFKRFYRGRNATELNVPGNGLGLAIADEVVKIHNGRLDLTSEVGVGTTFRVWLPLMRFM